MTSTMAKITFVSFLFLLFFPHLIAAETKTFIKEYTYQASEDDSRNSSRVTAMREVKRLLLEELGTYLESVTEIKNFQLTKDQITALTAGIVKTEIVSERWDGHTYWIKTKIVADSDNVIKSIDNLRKDRDKSRELEEVKKKSDAILEENKRLREKLKLAKGEDKQILKDKYDKTIKELSATEWLENGIRNYHNKDYKTALHDYNKAIELNPKYADAYFGRGVTYHSFSKHDEAISDYNKAIELNPKYADAYYNRGLIYGGLGKYDNSFSDLNKAIELNPKYANAYYNRGVVYLMHGYNVSAIQDLKYAIQINPDLRNDAKTNRNFDNIRNTSEFKRLIVE
jgi:tetratricopeptide (TPR) repeat protein